MDSFKEIILTIAVVLLIFCLSIVGLGLALSGNSQEYPPVKSDCPDYWSAQKTGSSTSCQPPVGHGSGTGGCGAVNTGHPMFNGPNGTCNKYKWAQRCGVTWDGVTNVNSPCSDTST